MIALSAKCLLFRMSNGESMPVSEETITTQVTGETARGFDVEFVQHAASAVFHYFKFELERQEISCEEFSAALGTVLKGFGQKQSQPRSSGGVVDLDLVRLAAEAGAACELFLFPRLRDEFRKVCNRAQRPRTLRFRSLRRCVKQLAGARRWSPRCELLEEQILDYLRSCLHAETKDMGIALVVEG